MTQQQGRGENVLITGASSGIGLATALYLAGKGYSVVGTSRSEQGLAALRGEASRRSVEVTASQMDINTDEGVGRVLPQLMKEQGGIDVLVNNAGYGLWGPGGTLSMKEMRDQFETNFFAAFRLMRAVLPGMIERGKGTIVNISSVEGRLGTPFSGGYAASKFALEGLSESMRLELWPLGVRIVLVEPGLFRTNFPANQVIAEGVASSDLPLRPFVERYRARRPRFDFLKGDPVKVARVVHKIVRSRRPRFRYQVGPEARLGILAARFMPERAFQALLSRATLG